MTNRGEAARLVGMARPRVNTPKRSSIRKVPVIGGKALPGRPRKDGLPPIQHKAAAVLSPEELAERAVLAASAAFLNEIRRLAPRLPPKLLAAQIRRHFPSSPVVAEDFEAKGRYYEIILQGRADAVMEVSDALVDRAKAGGKGTIDAMFFLKCQGDWAETPAAREKAKKADDDDRFVGLDVTWTE